MSAIPATMSPARNADHVDALPVGARLGEFEIIGLLGVGGFGMVYQAFDHSLLRFVAIKEYMPTALAGRAQGHSLWVRSSSDEPSFKAGLASFVGEARLLAQFDHPSLVKVFRFWEANHTAYMVMPLYAGMTLKQARTHMRTPPPEFWLRKVIWSICGALRVLHEGKTLHRDVSPDNIFLQDIGPPVLLDLGAARFAIEDADRKHTAVLKVNYAPIEQYSDNDSELKSGPWSDVYSLAAVIYGCICNDMPLPSTLRSIRDRLVPFSRVAKTVRTQFGVEYSPAFVEAVSRALSLQPQDRPQSVDEFLTLMGMSTAPAGLDKFDFRAELGAVWVEPDGGGKRASPLNLDLTDGSAPVLAAESLLQPRGAVADHGARGSHRSDDFQDTVLREVDFEDTRNEPPQERASTAAIAAPVQTLESAISRQRLESQVIPASNGSGGAKASRSAKSESPVASPPFKKPRNAPIAPADGGSRSRAGAWMLASAALVVVAAAGAWWYASSPSVAQVSVVAQPVVYKTPDDQVITEQSEAASSLAAQAASAAAAASATAAAASAALQAGAFAVSSDQKPRLSPVRKPVEPVIDTTAAVSSHPALTAPEPKIVSASVAQPERPKQPSPEEACAGSGFLTKPMCIHNECQKPGMQGQPVCVESKRKRDDERRQRQLYSQ